MGTYRKSFGRIKKVVDIPDLIEIQTRSYEKFLQADVRPEDRGKFGLQGAFKSVFPIVDFGGKCSLEFVSYQIGEPRYDVRECTQKGMTYNAPLRVVIRLVVFDNWTGRRRAEDCKGYKGTGDILRRDPVDDPKRAPLMSMVLRESSLASCIGHRAYSLTTTKGKPM